MAWGQALLDADCERVGAVSALGLDETLYKREGRWRTRRWCTSIVDVSGGQLLDVVPGRDATAPTAWLEEQPSAWRDGITWGTLDLSGAYRSAFTEALPRAGQVADPFHVIRLADDAVDETRRRIQNDTLGHRGRRGDPLYRIRPCCWQPTNASTAAPTPDSAACSHPATPAARSAWRGTPRKLSEAPQSLSQRVHLGEALLCGYSRSLLDLLAEPGTDLVVNVGADCGPHFERCRETVTDRS